MGENQSQNTPLTSINLYDYDRLMIENHSGFLIDIGGKEMQKQGNRNRGGVERAFGPSKFWVQSSIALFLVVSQMAVTGCAQIAETVKASVAEEELSDLPNSDLTTYVIDLSGSTYPLDQIAALGSGIDDFISGETYGNPFSSPKKAPKGLSIQFITENSANAPRIVLASVETSNDLYEWMINNSPNLDQAKQVWDGFVRARKTVWNENIFQQSNCTERAVTALGTQGISADLLAEPARIICDDANASFEALNEMKDFVENPDVPMGSDVFGALNAAVSNLNFASENINVTKKIIVIASDLIDTNPDKDFTNKLMSIDDPKQACELGQNDQSADPEKTGSLRDFSIVLVGLGNTKAPAAFIEKTRNYWFCYLESAGAKVNEVTDLAGY